MLGWTIANSVIPSLSFGQAARLITEVFIGQMADSEGSLSASVIRMLVQLGNKYRAAADQAVYEWEDEERELTEIDQNKKMEVFDKLHSSLLPAINHHLSCLVTSLDLVEHAPRKFPSPKLGLTLETLSSLERTLDQIIVDFAILKTPLPTVPHDHPQDRYKCFRSDRLIANITDLIQGPIHSTLLDSNYFIRLWELSTTDPDRTAFQISIPQAVQTVLEEITESTQLVNKILRFSQISDLDILQEWWQENVDSLDGTIQALTHITHSALGQQRPLSAIRTNLLKEFQTDITFLKLLRTLYDKVSKSATKKLAYRLDPQTDSKALSTMYLDVDWMNGSLSLRMSFLFDLFKNDEPHGDIDRRQMDMSQMSRHVDSMLLHIALYLTPLPTAIDHTSPESDFKAWLIMWQVLWHTVITRY
ncbi:hypothetical protein PGTUg99_013038 [Puccinia graminis f. sp. tritici]|uniref:Uncharacterized protein n=1 Tax=Puccinia graminis f. sp. tritici TaxID=56615 RepID=A0A5B0NIN6_PUCGR|nr:hypothetical protein PGTUg99_013038 [Puccinia graminis f. sp. tritici]